MKFNKQLKLSTILIAARGPSNFVKLHKCDGSIKELKEISKELNAKKLGPTIKKPDPALQS